MNVYIYAAGLYCEDCGKTICKQIREENHAHPAEYPQGPYPDGGGESDCPEHCSAGPTCINAIKFDDGIKVGVWLENELTTAGIEYVKETIREGGEVAELWAEYYCDYDL